MNFLTIPERLLTWLDVERVLKKKTFLWERLPTGIGSISCFPDGMDVSYSGSIDAAKQWLKDVFGKAYDAEKTVIRLRILDATYPVAFIEDSNKKDLETPATYPLWREMAYVSENGTEVYDEATADEKSSLVSVPRLWDGGPRVVSFHSFKGGVGRTTALMTYVAACLQEVDDLPKKILIIDADIEAPGVSFWLDEINRPKVSFIQLIEALHYPPVNIENTLDYFAEELNKTSLNVSGAQRELFVLPAALELTEIQDMPVQPMHLARNPKNPWVLTDHLRSLGLRLGVDAVFVDLRAGLSELASPVLFDPRVEHFFVTTVATQSVAGMAEVLKRLHAFNSHLNVEWREQVKPSVILSLLTKELRESSVYHNALKILGEAHPGGTNDELTAGVEWLEAEFLSTLMSVSSVREALEVLKQSTVLYGTAVEWAKSLYALPPPSLADDLVTAAVASHRHSSVAALKQICEQAQFAESDVASAMLATEPLRSLAKHYIREVPNVVIVGAKGAGKTFTFRQVVGSKCWSEFLIKVGFQATAIADAYIFPVLWSGNIEDKPDGEIKRAQNYCLDGLGIKASSLLAASDVDREIKKSLKSPPEHWDGFWDKLVCRQFGIKGDDVKKLNILLHKKKNPVILVFDGIEDAFDDPSKEAARDAIQALLRLPSRLSELTDRRLGAVVFVRADYVQAGIRQNQGQFLQRYLPFQLQWNAESFLRLAYWLCCQAGIFTEGPREVERLQLEDLKIRLESLWGRKLGSEKSKEAHSARWVYAALCDLRGNIQARDLVRFLKFAADIELERAGDSWPSRILSPESMRKAIPLCSVEKVEEAQKEISQLRDWMSVLQKKGVVNKKVPFSAKAMYLTSEMLSSLQEIGIVYEDVEGDLGEERLFLPEIYRSGLGFETSIGGRPRMQALLKKNLGSIPL